MKTLHIVRHGKSSWDLPDVSDIDRPLLEKGIQNNYCIAELLKSKFDKPGLVYSSPASRAIHTAIIFSKIMEVDFNNIKISENLYESETSTIINLIEKNSSEIKNILIVGHNPVFTKLANLYLPEYLENIPTSGVVTLQFDIKNWGIIDKTPVATEFNFP